MSYANVTYSNEQKKGIYKTLVGILVFVFVILGLFINKVVSPSMLSKDELRANGAILFDAARAIKPFSLVDQNNHPVNADSFKGKLNLVFFGFMNCPDICPDTMAKIAATLKALDEEAQIGIQVSMITVDPARDTSSQLKGYVEYFNSNFIGLTGEFRQILSLSQNLNVAFHKVPTDSGYTYDHTGHIVLVDAKGHYVGFIKSPFDVNKLSRVLPTLVSIYRS